MINDAQVRAARALLKWTQGDLAARSSVADRTIRAFEEGSGKPYDNTVARLQKAFEDAGVAFLASEAGVGVMLLASAEPEDSPPAE